MGFSEKARPAGSDYSPKRHNANHFLTRPRLDDSELEEWLIAAFSNKPGFHDYPQNEMLQAIKDEVDKSVKDIFGKNSSIRSMGGITFLLTQMVQNIEEAQGHDHQGKDLPKVIKRAYDLMLALDQVTKGERLRHSKLEALRHGDEIMNELADYAREVALVLPVTIKDQEVRDRIRSTSRGMPAVDLKLCSIAREYEEHIRPGIPSFSLTGRVA